MAEQDQRHEVSPPALPSGLQDRSSIHKTELLAGQHDDELAAVWQPAPCSVLAGGASAFYERALHKEHDSTRDRGWWQG